MSISGYVTPRAAVFVPDRKIPIGVTTGDILGNGFFLAPGQGYRMQNWDLLCMRQGNNRKPKPNDYLIPLEAITRTDEKWGSPSIYISLSYADVQASPTRWQMEQAYSRQGARPAVQPFQVPSPPITHASVVVDSPTPPPQKSIMGSFESALSQMAAITAMKEKMIKEFGMIPPKMQELFDKAELECLNGVTLDTISLTGVGGTNGNG